MLSVVLRYGATQRQRLGLNYNGRGSVDSVRVNGGEGASAGGEGEGEREVDAVAAMVEGVKTRGVSLTGLLSLVSSPRDQILTPSCSL